MATTEKKLSNDQKKEFAKTLFLHSKMTQKEIACEVDVSENTMTDWKIDGKWELLKTSIVTTDAEQLAQLRKILKRLNEQADEYLNDDDPTTNPDTDGIIKITKAIHYLQTKTGVGQMYETGLAFLTFLQKQSPNLAKQVAPLFHAFIKTNL